MGYYDEFIEPHIGNMPFAGSVRNSEEWGDKPREYQPRSADDFCATGAPKARRSAEKAALLEKKREALGQIELIISDRLFNKKPLKYTTAIAHQSKFKTAYGVATFYGHIDARREEIAREKHKIKKLEKALKEMLKRD